MFHDLYLLLPPWLPFSNVKGNVDLMIYTAQLNIRQIDVWFNIWPDFYIQIHYDWYLTYLHTKFHRSPARFHPLIAINSANSSDNSACQKLLNRKLNRMKLWANETATRSNFAVVAPLGTLFLARTRFPPGKKTPLHPWTRRNYRFPATRYFKSLHSWIPTIKNAILREFFKCIGCIKLLWRTQPSWIWIWGVKNGYVYFGTFLRRITWVYCV